MEKPTLTRKSVEKILMEIKCPFTGFHGGIEETVDKIERVNVITKKAVLKRYRIRLSKRFNGLLISNRIQWRAFHEGSRVGMYKMSINRLKELGATNG